MTDIVSAGGLFTLIAHYPLMAATAIVREKAFSQFL